MFTFGQRHSRKSRSRNSRRRSGFSLIELSLGLTGGVGVLLLAIGTVHQTMTLSSMGKERAERQQTFARVGHQFRADVYAASESALTQTDTEQQLKLQLGDGVEVIYTNSPAGFKRVQTKPEATLKSQELAQVGDGYQLSLAQSEAPTRVELKLERRAVDEVLLEGRVIASLGRNRLLETIASPTERP